jgi:hypothetical protein
MHRERNAPCCKSGQRGFFIFQKSKISAGGLAERRNPPVASAKEDGRIRFAILPYALRQLIAEKRA